MLQWWPKMTNQHIGSSLEDLLEETGELAEANAAALKRVTEWEKNSHKMNAEDPSDADHPSTD